MNAIVKKLLWKEFQELKWETAASAAIVLTLPVCLAFRDANLALMTIMPNIWLYPILAGVFFGARAAAGERTGRTASFVAALPVSHRLLGMVRLAATFLASMLPLAMLWVLAMFLNSLVDENSRMQSPWLSGIFLLALLATISCISVAARAGLGQSTEIRAGLIGFAAVLGALMVGGLWLFVVLLMLQSHYDQPPPWAEAAMLGCSLIAGIPATIFVAAWFINGYSRALGILDTPSLKGWTFPDWRLRIFSAPLSALVGKAVREMGLMGLEVLGVSLLLSIVAGMLGITNSIVAGRATTVVELAMGALPVILAAGGFVLALLVGVGAVIGDVQPGVNTFWRSRPISPRAWYWTNYGVGLVTMVLAVEIPALLVGLTGGQVGGNHGVLIWLLMWNLAFTFALTATCLLRKPGAAALLAFAAVHILYSLAAAAFDIVTPGEQGAAPPEIIAPVFAVAFFGSTAIGSWAAVNDVAVT
ncbi:MAG TPA: hypothetical protein VGI40_09245 [Pirellulaceae bacterium]|jgi:hypothetical protein